MVRTRKQHPNPEWMQTVLAIQESYSGTTDTADKSSFKVVGQADGHKRRKMERVVPEVRTFGATEVRKPGETFALHSV